MLAGIQVPQPERAVAVGTGQQAPVRAEGYAVLVFLAAHVHLEGGARSRPVAGFQSRIAPSLYAQAGNLPSGLKATPFTLRVAAASLLAVSCPVSRVVLIAQAWQAQDTQHAAMADRSAIRESMAWLPAPT